MPTVSEDIVQQVPETHRSLLADETRALAFLATLMPDGSPQVTPVWFSVESGALWINSAQGRVKDRNMRARPQVALCISDPHDPYRYLQIRGRVVAITTEAAEAHIHRLAHKYTGQDWSIPPGEVRVRYRIQARHISAH